MTDGVELQCPDEAAANDLREAIIRGDITWHAGPMNMQHEFANEIVYRFGLDVGHQLDTMFNTTHAAKVLRNTDVPDEVSSKSDLATYPLPLLLVTSVDDHWKPVQSCSFGDLNPSLGSNIWWW